MEAYLKIVEKGNLGDEDALKDLGLGGIQEVPFNSIMSQPTMEALAAEYSRAKKVALGANILNVGVLEMLGCELMTLLDFLARTLYKSRISDNVKARDVARALQIRIQNIKTWYDSIGDLDEGQHRHHTGWLNDCIDRVVEGDSEAIVFFGLDEGLIIETDIMKEIPSVTKLKMYFRRAKESAAVGKYIGDIQLKAIGTSVMTYTAYLAEIKHNLKLEVPIDGEYVAGSLLAHIQSLKALGERLQRHRIGDQSGDEHSGRDSDTDDGDNNSEGRASDPDYEPMEIARPKCTDQELKKNIVHEARTTMEQTKSSIENEAPEKKNMSSTQKQEKSEASQKAGEEQKKKKQSHHAIKTCPIRTCHYKGPNLLRHLRAVHKLGQEAVSKLNSIAKLEGKRRGPRRTSKAGHRLGPKIKWCPFEGCHFATHLLRRHLQREHKLKNGEVLQNYLRMAKEYMGKLEQEEVQLNKVRKRRQSVSNDEQTQKVPRMDGEIHEDGLEGSTPEQESNEDNVEDGFIENEPQEEYFTAAVPRNDRHQWLILFYEYLAYPDCGRKKNRNRLQHASHIRTILEDLEPKGTGIDVLAEDEGYVVWTQWVDRKMGLKSSGTINAYLGTYETFLAFVTLDRVRPGNVPALAEEVTKILRNTKNRLKGWRRTVDLEARPLRNQRLLDECDTRLTTEDVEKFKASRTVATARKTFQKAASSMPLTRDEICEARDLLICLITIKTGTRPGALENVRLQHYRNMRCDPVNGDPVILVPEHKRAVDGPAMLALDEELVDLLSIYVESIHPQFPSPQDDYLFLQSSGKRFTNGTINRRMPEMWLRSGVRTDMRVTATNIRKFIVTVLQENKAAGKEFDEAGVRIAMCHSQRTAMYSYLREDLTAVASRAARTIRRFTDRSSHDRAVDKSMNEAATSQSQPFKKSINDADDSVVQHSGNRDENASSNSQHFNKPANENDFPTAQQPSVVDDKADPNNQPQDAEDSVVQHSGNRDENASSNSQHFNKPANENDFPTAQQPSAVDDKADPNNQPQDAEDSIVQHSRNRDENITSNCQHFNKPANENDFPTAKQPSVVDDKADPNNQPLEVQSRRPLTEEEKQYSQHLFRETIRLNETITMKAVRATIKNDEKLKKLGSIEGMIKKMVDYLRNLQKNEPRKDPKELSVIQKKDMVEQWLKSTDCETSSSTCSTVKVKWSDEDVDKIVTVFTRELGSLKKLPSRSQVRIIFEEHLADILQRKTYQRCYNKIKHLVDLTKKKKK